MIDIVDHRPAWQHEFGHLGAVLRHGLGSRARRIDHIGSTAIQGLCAKDVIDIQITVARLDSEADAALRGLGYVWHADIVADHVPPGHAVSKAGWAKLFFTQPAGQRRVNVHMRQAAKPNQRYALLFRDYLIHHPPAASAYGELKRRLAAALANDDDYPHVKDPVIDLIHFAAEQWAAAAAWRPSSSGA